MIAEESTILLPDGVSQRQIAEAIGVSISTVSRALSGHPKVSTRTRSDVVRAIDRLSKPAAPEKPLSATRRVIGLTRSHVLNGPALRSLDIILDQVLGGAEAAAAKQGYLLYTVQNSSFLRNGSGDPMLNAVEGVVTAGGLVSLSIMDALRSRQLPVVIIGGHVPDLPIASVGANSFEGTRMAVRHLVDLGHRRVGLVNGPTETYTSLEKKAGYLTALADAGIAPDPNLIRWHDGPTGFDVTDAIAMAGELLDREERPTAIVFANDSMAVAGITACRQRNLAVPRDVSIVGFHDDPDAQLASPQLTTIRVDRNAWGAAAVRRLLAWLNDGDAMPDRRLLPVQLIVRDSTTHPPR